MDCPAPLVRRPRLRVLALALIGLAWLLVAPACIDEISLFEQQFTCSSDSDCIGGWRCDHGICVSGGACVPDCAADPCGDDGCGGFCGPCMVHYGMNGAQLQSLLDKVEAQGSFRTTWIDGFVVGGGTFYNAVFDQSPVGKHMAWIDLVADELATKLVELESQGKQVVHLESYPLGGETRYAVISEQGPGPHWCALFGLSVDDFQAHYDSLAGTSCQVGVAKCNDQYTGCYRPVNVTVVQHEGSTEFAALFAETDTGHWHAQSLLEVTAFSAERATQQADGRYASHMDGYVHEGNPVLSVIWDSEGTQGATPTIDLDGDTFRDKATQLSDSGLTIEMITGWEVDGEARYGAIWRDQ